MLTDKQISYMIIHAGIPDKLKIFLFGMTGKDVERISHKGIPYVEIDTDTTPTDNISLHERIDEWLNTGRNLASDFTIEEMADGMNISRYALKRYFECQIHTDFRIWKSSMRIEKAKEILLSSDNKQINDIAKTVGFKDKSNFHRRFKKATGKTPLEWKDTCGGLYDSDD